VQHTSEQGFNFHDYLSLTVNQHVSVYVAHLTLPISLTLSLYSNNNTQSSTFVLGISISFSRYLSRSLPPSLLHVSLCISIISSRCIRVRLVCVDSDKKRAKKFDSDKKRASSLVHVQGKSWYQSVEFLSLSLSLSLLSFCLVSLSDRNQRERRGVISKVTPGDKKGTPVLSFSLIHSRLSLCKSNSSIEN